tara:strand:- start:4053 stop:4658 length:606 start_codon:yes stop_codon:yes gene_type:complete
MTSAASTSAVITHNLSSSLTRRRFSFSSSSSSFSSSSSCLFALKRRRTNHRNLASTKVQATSFMEIAQLGLDLDRNTVGPAVFAIATLGVSWVFYDGSMQMKQLKEELDSRGVDSSLFNKLYELKYIKRALDSGDQSAYDEAEERIQWQRSKIVVATGSITEVQKIKKFWQTKGIEVKTLADLDKVEEYMVEKYGGKAIKF